MLHHSNKKGQPMCETNVAQGADNKNERQMQRVRFVAKDQAIAMKEKYKMEMLKRTRTVEND